MEKSFNYHKEFFHRPLWTPANRRFFLTLISVFVVTFGITLALIQYMGFLPEVKLHRTIKEKYITYLSNIYLNTRPKVEVTQPAPQAKIVHQPAPPLAKTTIEEVIKSTTQPAKPSAASNPEVTALQKGRVGGTGTNPVIAQAIEAVPGLIQPSESRPVFSPTVTYRRKAESYEVAKVITGAYEGVDYSIPPPEYTDFEIAQGYRNEEEIIMAVNGKKKYIRYCINKFHRNDPSIRGNIVVKFKIHPDGYVIPSSIKIVESDIPDPRVLRCIKRVIARWRDFPKVAYEDGIYTVTQKYVF